MKYPEYIPLSRPQIDEDEINEVVETMRSGWLTTGEKTMRFERDFRAYTGARHALGVNSCTAGLHLALVALGIGEGDEVITSPLTFCATVNCIIHTGATPVLADILPNGNIDPASIERRITARTRAIIPVHIAGLPCDMDAIWALAHEYGLKVIEDAAHAAGTHYHGSHIGSLQSPSDAVAYSFYATKNLTTGEGGMVTTNDRDLAAHMRVLALHGISRDAWKRYTQSGNWYYEVLEPGFKYNLSDLQSAIGIHQLRKLEQFTELRSHYAALYTRLLEDVVELQAPPDTSDGRNAWHLYMLRLNVDRLTIDRAEFIEKLKDRNIGASVHFIPIPLHPFFAPWANRAENRCPQALQLYPRLVSLPLFPAMYEEQVCFIASAVKEIVYESKKSTLVATGTGD
jgi:dTDP-4-amino-4,6-dideoxygalactose transaminase